MHIPTSLAHFPALLSFPNNPNLDAIAKGIMPAASAQ